MAKKKASEGGNGVARSVAARNVASGPPPEVPAAPVVGELEIPGRPVYTPPNVRGWKPWAAKVLKNLSLCGNVRQACFVSGITTRAPYQLRKHDPVFREEWRKALQVATWEAETVYRHYAINGWTETTVRRGSDSSIMETMEKKRFSPKMLEVLLAKLDPEKWGAKPTGSVTSTNIVNVTGLQHHMADPRIAAMICELDEMMGRDVTVVDALPNPRSAEDVEGYDDEG